MDKLEFKLLKGNETTEEKILQVLIGIEAELQGIRGALKPVKFVQVDSINGKLYSDKEKC